MWNSLLQTYADGMKEFTETITSDVKQQIKQSKSDSESQQTEYKLSRTTTSSSDASMDSEIDDMFADFETPMRPQRTTTTSTTSGPPSALRSGTGGSPNSMYKSPQSTIKTSVNRGGSLMSNGEGKTTEAKGGIPSALTPRGKLSSSGPRSTPRTLQLSQKQREAIQQKQKQSQNAGGETTGQEASQEQTGKTGFWADIQTVASSTIQAFTNATASLDSSEPLSTTSGESNASNSSPLERYSWKQSKLDQIRKDPATFVNEPVNIGLFNEWKEEFDVQSKTDEIATLLSESEALKGLHTKFVPAVVAYGLFWERYFFQVHLIEQEEAKREKLLQVVEDDEDEDDWGSDEEVKEKEEEKAEEKEEEKEEEEDEWEETVFEDEEGDEGEEGDQGEKGEEEVVEEEEVIKEVVVEPAQVKPQLMSPRLAALQNGNGNDNSYLTPTKVDNTNVSSNGASDGMDEATPEWKAPVLVGTTPNTPEMMDNSVLDDSWEKEQEEDDEGEDVGFPTAIKQPTTPANKEELLKKIIDGEDEEDEDDWGW